MSRRPFCKPVELAAEVEVLQGNGQLLVLQAVVEAAAEGQHF
jgi:hypothetical protein